ncbi:hypothetical protein A2U01_0077887, partial [Trifolium medium]|nr:hypothetical protein [Trifolium medium]
MFTRLNRMLVAHVTARMVSRSKSAKFCRCMLSSAPHAQQFAPHAQIAVLQSCFV